MMHPARRGNCDVESNFERNMIEGAGQAAREFVMSHDNVLYGSCCAGGRTPRAIVRVSERAAALLALPNRRA